MAEDRVTKSLEKMRMQEAKREPAKKNLFFRSIDEMDFEAKTAKEEPKVDEDPSFIRKIEVVTRKMDEVISKMNAGSNYLMFYGQMQELEGQFLELTKDIELKKDKFPPQLFNRIMARKNDILRKKKK